jgi:hypothetical protein
MRRLLAICSAVGLLWAAGCHGHDHHCVHGRCDCDEGPAYGCHYEMYGPGHGEHAAVPVAVGQPVEGLKELPKGATGDVMPKDGAK